MVISSKTVTVASLDELLTALDNSTGGETILLAAGHYGELQISPKQLKNSEGVFDSTVTIRSADPADPAVFSGVKISGGQNLHFADLVFEFFPDEGHTTRSRLFDIGDWSPADRQAVNISVVNSKFTGHPVPEEFGGDPSDAQDVSAHGGNVAGMSTGIAFSAREASNISFAGNEVSGFFRGATFASAEEITFSNNHIHSLRSDGVNFAQVTNVVIEGNQIRDMTPWRHLDAIGKGDHADLIQFWTSGTTRPSENIVIRGNFLHASDGDASQSIFMRNELVDSGQAGEEMFFRNILIEDNLIYNSQANATRIGEGYNITIRNNTYVQNMDQAESSVNVPAITVALGSGDVTIENNIVPRIANQQVMEQLGFTIRNNLLTQARDPGGENYVGDLFIDALSGKFSNFADLQLLPGTLEDGLGAAMSKYDETPDELTAVVRSASGEYSGDDFYFVFDAGLTADADGLTGDRASYTWDLGDGTYASGQRIEHRYSQPGDYVVTLTVTGSDGSVSANQVKASIDSPVLFSLGLSDAGVADTSDYQVALSGDGAEAAIVTLEDGSLAYHLTNASTLTLERGASQLYNHDQFTFSLDLKRDMVSDGGGYLMMWVSSMRLRIDDDGFVTFDFWNADEEHFELISDVAIQDTDWHELALSYNAHHQEAALFLDGQVIGTAFMQGFTDVQESWGMQLGYAFKDNFEGLVRNVTFSNLALEHDVDAPLTPGEPKPYDGPWPENRIDLEPSGDIQSGTSQADHIVGTDGADVAKGLDGNDVFEMGEGDDIVNAGAGDDVMFGGAGNDTLRGFEGFDTAYGGFGDDTIYANVAFGDQGNDRLHGGATEDYLSGGDGDDAISGGDGNDVLIGGAGIDSLKGGAGNDLLIADNQDTLLHGGAGVDTAFLAEGGTFEFTEKLVTSVEVLDFSNGLQNTVYLTSISQIRQSDNDELVIQGDLGDSVRTNLQLERFGQEFRNNETFVRYELAEGSIAVLLDINMTMDWFV